MKNIWENYETCKYMYQYGEYGSCLLFVEGKLLLNRDVFDDVGKFTERQNSPIHV